MSIAEYQLSLKNLVDATTDETLLKSWKEQMEADLAKAKGKAASGNQESSLNESSNESTSEKKDDTSDYVTIESGLGIDE